MSKDTVISGVSLGQYYVLTCVRNFLYQRLYKKALTLILKRYRYTFYTASSNYTHAGNGPILSF